MSKVNKTKWTGGVAQAVEHLLSKLEAQNSNPSSLPQQKKFICKPKTASFSSDLIL
jgi:hypothetical protein